MGVVFGVTTYLLANKPNRITLLSLKFDLQQEAYEYVTSYYYSLIKYTLLNYFLVMLKWMCFTFDVTGVKRSLQMEGHNSSKRPKQDDQELKKKIKKQLRLLSRKVGCIL
jgi:hypothetical protein